MEEQKIKNNRKSKIFMVNDTFFIQSTETQVIYS